MCLLCVVIIFFLCVSDSSSKDKHCVVFIYPQCLTNGGPSVNAGWSKLRGKWMERLEQPSAEELKGWTSGNRNKEKKEVTYTNWVLRNNQITSEDGRTPRNSIRKCIYWGEFSRGQKQYYKYVEGGLSGGDRIQVGIWVARERGFPDEWKV